MNQGDGLGLDDYPLMMRYAYYFNTYYVDSALYADSWGFNDSLNTKHWYPELIANYYMWKNIEKKRSIAIRWIYAYMTKYMLIVRAKKFEDGTSFVKKKIDIDYKELYDVCNIKSDKFSSVWLKIVRFIVKMDQKRIRFLQKKEKINILA